MRLLLTKIAEDPLSSSCPNISYVDVTGPVASAYPTGSPYALFSAPPTGPPHHPSTSSGLSPCSPPSRCFIHPLQQHHHHYQGGGGANVCGGPLSTTSVVNSRADISVSVGRRAQNGRSGTSQSLLGTALPHDGGSGGSSGRANLWSSTSSPFPTSLDVVRGLLHSSGYTDDAIEEIIQAMQVLNGYGLLSLSNLASWVGFNGSGGGNSSRIALSSQITTLQSPSEPPKDASSSVTSSFGSAVFPSTPTGTLQQQSSSVDTFYRPQHNGSVSNAANNADTSPR